MEEQKGKGEYGMDAFIDHGLKFIVEETLRELFDTPNTKKSSPVFKLNIAFLENEDLKDHNNLNFLLEEQKKTKEKANQLLLRQLTGPRTRKFTKETADHPSPILFVGVDDIMREFKDDFDWPTSTSPLDTAPPKKDQYYKVIKKITQKIDPRFRFWIAAFGIDTFHSFPNLLSRSGYKNVSEKSFYIIKKDFIAPL